MLVSQTLPPLNWLRAFECAARHLSFTAAAGELSLTQSAVSQHVRSLELRLGTVLFVRKARGLALTNSGRQLLPSITGSLADLAAATAMFLPDRNDDSLKIACNWSFSTQWLSSRLDRFIAGNPGCHIQIVSTLWPDDSQLSDLDVEIRYGARELVGDGAQLLRADEIFPVCTPQLAKKIASVDDLYKLPLIQTVGTADTWLSWSDSLGFDSPPAASCAVDSYTLTLELVLAGVGVGLISGFIADNKLNSGELVAPLECKVPAKDNHYLLVRQNDDSDSLASRFSDWIRIQIAA